MKRKYIQCGKLNCKVTLSYDGIFYNVKVDGNLYYRSCNQLFAVQRFNEI